MSTGDLVLVTGGSGFVGSHCLLLFLQKGYRVRTTVRSLKRADEVRQMLVAGGVTEEQANSVEFCAANLTSDEGWIEACEDCTYVLHVASPFPAGAPKHEDDLIIPAREGTLRVLKAAKAAGSVKRVVVTSSFAAIGYGHPDSKDKFTEADWTLLDHPAVPVAPYQKSKTIAERAAWDYIAKEGGDMQLSVINPVGIFGPTLGKNFGTSVEIIARLMNGQLPGLPQISFGAVDVRDVASLHLLAMTSPQAAGQRYLAVSGDFLSMQAMALMLKKRLPQKAKKVPTRVLPNILVRLVGLFDKGVGLIVTELGKYKNASSAKATEELGWRPMSVEDSLVASAESLERFGLLK